MKILLCITTGFVVFFSCDSVFGETEKRSYWTVEREKWARINRTKPYRRDEPLRYENISDFEVREIESETKEVFPGAIVNISGVTTGCPCENGRKCTSEVWVVAYQDHRSDGLMLSRIDGKWSVGPVQRWWMSYEDLNTRMTETIRARKPGYREKYRGLVDASRNLREAFPKCVSQD